MSDPYADIIRRLGEATEASRELDAWIDAALFGGRPACDFTEGTPGAKLRRSYSGATVFLNPDPEDNGGHVLTRHYRHAPTYSSSLDSAIALVEQLDADAYYRIHKLTPAMRHAAGRSPEAKFWASCGKAGEQENDYGPTAPLALLLALFKALDAGRKE